ncbi:C40 family peptidase [Kocuria sp. cx-116]|uniref:C40 family peptidase n=1 Tax=Kocuria sp. cx-116 TaxID=2771378 RepID=UPI001688551D|nr:C40 family peptidase [Kocuria sp. cx-116]MBD2761861.1 C40 family peptidase [Kocuria sp. cx-116]
MFFLRQNPGRHRAHTPSRLARNTIIATAAGAVMIGSVAPAQAYAAVPTPSAPSYQVPATASLAGLSSYTYEAFVAPQAVPNVQPVASSLAPQSTATTAATPATDDIVGAAIQGEGTGYVWGGAAFGAWDCSGFTQWAYARNGIDLPRTSYQQIEAGTPTANPQPGDLVSQNGGAHIGIYIGAGKMISALNPTQGTFVHDMNSMPVDGYYTYR